MRRLVLVGSLAVGAGAGVFLACSSDETPASPSGTSSGTTGGTSGSSGSSGNSGGSNANNIIDQPDASGVPSPGDPSCIIHCTEYKTAGKVVSLPREIDAGLTTVPWTNPEGATKEDGQLATVTLAETQESDWLYVSNFDFSIITDEKETWGIQIELERQSDDAGVKDAFIEAFVDNPVEQAKVRNHPIDDGFWPRLIVGTHHYGQAVDTWGFNLNPPDIRKAAFGARIAAKRRPGITSAPVVAKVDSLKVSVCACNADKK